MLYHNRVRPNTETSKSLDIQKLIEYVITVAYTVLLRNMSTEIKAPYQTSYLLAACCTQSFTSSLQLLTTDIHVHVFKFISAKSFNTACTTWNVDVVLFVVYITEVVRNVEQESFDALYKTAAHFT